MPEETNLQDLQEEAQGMTIINARKEEQQKVTNLIALKTPEQGCLVRWLDIHTCPRLYAWPQLFSSYNKADLFSALRLSSALTIFK